MAKRRSYKRDNRGRFAEVSGAAAKRIERRATPKATTTKLGFSVGLIEARGVKLHNTAFTLDRSRKINTAELRSRPKKRRA